MKERRVREKMLLGAIHYDRLSPRTRFFHASLDFQRRPRPMHRTPPRKMVIRRGRT